MNLHAIKLARLLAGAFALGLTVLILAGALLGWRLCTVLSGSMEPTLPVGSLLVVVPEPEPKPGQILTFSQGGMLVTHRAVAQNPDGTLVTRGDANTSPDGAALDPQNIKGRVVFCLPLWGYAAMLLSSRLGRAAAAAIATALVLLAFWPKRKEKAHECQ